MMNNGSNSNGSGNNSLNGMVRPGGAGRGDELRYEFYFPENACMVQQGPVVCPKINYPLMSGMPCRKPCNTNFNPEIYGNNPQPSELYGDAIGFNGGDHLFYYDDPKRMLGMHPLTFPQGVQPYHYQKPF